MPAAVAAAVATATAAAADDDDEPYDTRLSVARSLSRLVSAFSWKEKRKGRSASAWKRKWIIHHWRARRSGNERKGAPRYQRGCVALACENVRSDRYSLHESSSVEMKWLK
ncbi:hypothetical protein ALC62_10562 [Cyphomyrmex costatus]|uniref:Uncharacterized protein n=1 Tax=Cyphomyrmex costatus TaxID=456900 RepID=A0A195CCL0_9HYME|nr:hypothetical protein ALC62_10562 [Cyphomyrmex costatus]